MDAHVDDGEDRFAVRTPHRLIERVRKVSYDRARRATRGGRDEEVRVVVRLEPVIGIGEEQQLRVVGRQLSARLVDVECLARDDTPVRAARIHRPDFAAEHIVQQRRSGAVKRDSCAVRRQTVLDHRPVPLGQARFLTRRHDDFPQVPLLVILVKRVHVVPQSIAFTLRRGPWLTRKEIDRRAVGRPRWRSWQRRMMGQRPGFAAGRGEQLQLAVADEENRRPVGGPARLDWNVTGIGEGQLRGRSAAVRLTPQLPDGPSHFPIRFALKVNERATVR